MMNHRLTEERDGVKGGKKKEYLPRTNMNQHEQLENSGVKVRGVRMVRGY
jgi:hypothetical protein